jgi:hypothetical protein
MSGEKPLSRNDASQTLTTGPSCLVTGAPAPNLPTRLLACNGSAQLVAAMVAAETCAPASLGTGNRRDALVIHDLCAPGGQSDSFAALLERLAREANRWERIVYLRPTQLAQLSESLGRDGRDAAIARLRQLLQFETVDELYLGQNKLLLNDLLKNTFRGARKVCYGDGIGVNFSSYYFAPAALPQPVPTDRRAHLRSAVRRARRFVKRLLEHGPKREEGLPEIGFDEHCLLLPNLFDEQLSRFKLTDPKAFQRWFRTFGQVLDSVLAGNVARLQGELREFSQFLILLTSNFSESGKMTLDDELAAYRELVQEQPMCRHAALVLKPHPRDSQEKIDRLRTMLEPQFVRVFVLDDALSFYLPFEVIFVRLFLSAQSPINARVACVSSACLGLEYLYDTPCVIGFGERQVRRYFAPTWIDHRLQHEYDLRRAVDLIRQSRQHRERLSA